MTLNMTKKNLNGLYMDFKLYDAFYNGPNSNEKNLFIWLLMKVIKMVILIRF